MVPGPLGYHTGVRGCPERDIPSLCVMGGWWEMLGNSSAAAAVAAVAAAAAAPPKSGSFLVNVFFTIRSQNRDLDATPPGNYSYGRRAPFLF